MAKDYYDILGIDRNATENDIKKAFKKLSLKYHPDRHANDSEEEKKEAEEKFKEINEAYSILSDKEKKQYYDTFGSLDGMNGGPSMNAEDIFERFARSSPFGFNRGFHQAYETGTNIRMEVPFTIEDFYCGTTKTLKYKKKYRCPVCHGAGGSGETSCPDCNGTGVYQRVYREGFSQTIVSSPCSRCNGKGKIYQYECNRCHGSGFDEKETTVTIDFPAGMMPNTGSAIKGAGNESSDIRGEDGMFIAVPIYAIDTKKYEINGYDIKEFVDVPYYDALLGCDVTVKLPNKEEKVIKLSECTKDGKLFRLTNCGIHIDGREIGNYLVQVRYVYPNTLSSNEKSALEKIKKATKK